MQKTIPTDEFYSQLGNKELQRAERVYEKAAAKTPTSNKQDLKQSVLTMHKTSEVGSRRISDAGIRKNVLSQTGSHGMRQSQ